MLQHKEGADFAGYSYSSECVKWSKFHAKFQSDNLELLIAFGGLRFQNLYPWTLQRDVCPLDPLCLPCL